MVSTCAAGIRVLLSLVETSLRLVRGLLLISFLLASSSEVEAVVFISLLRSLESYELRVVFFIRMSQFLANLNKEV